MRLALLLYALLPAAAASGANLIGDIEFFGYKGINLEAVQRALPVHKGDPYSDDTKAAVRKAVTATLHKEPTDVAGICCDESGNQLLFIGLPGASSHKFAYSAEPTGASRLPDAILALYSKLDHAFEAAVRKGGDSAQEDDSQGYALIKDPAARKLQLEVRDWALQHESEILSVLASSSLVEHRRVASDALGYVHQSPGQIAALVKAASDPDDEVRNNATRALGVLVRSNAKLASSIPPSSFIAMLNSGTWTDRNKAAALLDSLTASRDPQTLSKIKASALDSLIEMASWRRAGHAFFARMVLGRIAGIPEEKLSDLAWNGPVSDIISAARK